MTLVKALGSLKFAIALIAGFAVMLTASTLLESAYGTPFAQKTFYTARWFDAFLGLIWVNIFCATWTRFPFKKHHTGFVITHLGILTLLLGALVSRVWGTEGTMTLFEGEKKASAMREGHSLEVTHGESFARLFPLKSGRTKYPYPLEGTGLRVLGTTDRAVEKRVVTEGGPSDAPNAAVLVTLTSETLGVDETFWLVERDPADVGSHAREIGPAHLELRRKNPSGKAVLRITREAAGRSVEIPLDGGAPAAKEISFAGTDLTVRDLHYYPKAKISGGKLVDAPQDVRFNPAVEFEVVDSKGRVERHTRFLLFPHFGSLRGGAEANLFDLSVAVDADLPEEIDPVPVPSLVFFAAESGWSTRVSSSRKEPVEAPLETGKKIATGWMDIVVEAKKTFERARVSRVVQEDLSAAQGLFAVRIATKDGDMHWILEGQKTILAGTAVRLVGEEIALPFALGLKDFRKIDYPGTANPASFESDVVLMDEKKGVTLGKTIRMNQPLDYAGWRVFQSSYIQDPRFGEASVFSIAKNPGIGLLYGGAAVIFAGVILLFYLHPFFAPSPEARVPRKNRHKETGRHATAAR